MRYAIACGLRLGALLTLMLIGMPLDVIGIIKKNGIMLVDFALVGQRERGLSTEMRSTKRADS